MMDLFVRFLRGNSGFSLKWLLSWALKFPRLCFHPSRQGVRNPSFINGKNVYKVPWAVASLFDNGDATNRSVWMTRAGRKTGRECGTKWKPLAPSSRASHLLMSFQKRKTSSPTFDARGNEQMTLMAAASCSLGRHLLNTTSLQQGWFE